MTYKIFIENNGDRQAAALFAYLAEIWHGIKTSVTKNKAESDIRAFRDNSLPLEGFRLTCEGRKAAIFGNGTAGVLHGFSTLVSYCAPDGFARADLNEAPHLPFRGAHFYMPSKYSVDSFKKIIDMLVYLKINTIFIEVGGGMEYKKHPEINAGWERFCKTMNNFPGGPVHMQTTDCVPKNATHTEVGGGSFISKDAVRELVSYAKNYGMDVIPELQMLSHAYYITAVYPEYAEHRPDFNPDTVCPLNEDAYKLYFELAEETIDAFGCNKVSIGHDEIRIMGLCEKCRQYTGHELLAYEINRLYDFYKSKNVGVMMWAEKLLTTVSYFTKKARGGCEENWTRRFDRSHVMPATHEALNKIPKDILLIDWMYLQAADSQKETEQNGFMQIYGNFCGEITRFWNKRLTKNILGAAVSSWCTPDEATLGHDGIIGELWYSAKMLWDKNYDEDKNDDYQTEMQNILPMLREALRGKRSVSVSVKNRDAVILYPGAAETTYHRLPAAALPDRGIWSVIKRQDRYFYGVPVGEAEITFAIGKKIKNLAFVHTCLAEREIEYSYNFPIDKYFPVVYAVRYGDGATVHLNMMFGRDIGNIKLDFGRRLNYTGKTPTAGMGFGLPEYPWKYPDTPLYILNHSWKNSLMYAANPIIYDGGCCYIAEWENPRPDVLIERVFAVNNALKREEQAVLYCAAGVLNE